MERLNKFLAHAGVASRRQCDEFIAEGRVKIDGVVVRELGTRVGPDQQVTVDDKPVQVERLVYWLVNKPRGVLCTNFDPEGRPLALDLVDHVGQRVYTVGRLDEQSEGLLLMTNDGELAFRLTHPRFGIEKTYHVLVAGRPTLADINQLLEGIWLAEGHVHAKRAKKLRQQGESTWLEIVLAEGKNREIRRMLARLGHKVLELKRLSIGPLKIGNLRPGKCRPLTHEEREVIKGLAAKVGGRATDSAPRRAGKKLKPVYKTRNVKPTTQG